MRFIGPLNGADKIFLLLLFSSKDNNFFISVGMLNFIHGANSIEVTYLTYVLVTLIIVVLCVD